MNAAAAQPPIIRAADGRMPHGFVVFAAVLGPIVLILGASFCLGHGIGWSCPARELLHLPCPSCGSTRALAALCGFHFVQALKFNPLITVVACSAPFFPWLRLGPMLEKRWSWMALCILVGLNWLYLLFFLPR